MIAVIHLVPHAPTAASCAAAAAGDTHGLLPVAGRPLIARQLDWLIGLGFGRILVETGHDAASQGVADWLHEKGLVRAGDSRVTLVPSEERRGLRDLADRAGVSSARSLLAIPADLLGDGDLRRLYPVANAFGVVAFFAPPRGLEHALVGGTVRLVRAPLLHRRQRPAMVQGPGWGARLRSESDSERLSAAALKGALPGRAGGGHAWPFKSCSTAAA